MAVGHFKAVSGLIAREISYPNVGAAVKYVSSELVVMLFFAGFVGFVNLYLLQDLNRK